MGRLTAILALLALGLGAPPPGASQDAPDADAADLGAWSLADEFPDLALPEGDGAVTPEERRRQAFLRAHPNIEDALVVGELLTFSVRYGPVRAGEATMGIVGIEVIDGDSCYHVVSTAESNSFFSTFFHVQDRVETFMDMEWLLPRRFEKHLIEGKWTADEVVEFDQRNDLAIYDDGTIVDLPPDSHDILTAFYSGRARDLRPGDAIDLESHADGKNYPLRIKVHRRERVEVPAGEFDCIVVEPLLRSPGLFKHKGQLLVWLTDDPRKIPVQMKSELPIGAISVVLTDVEGRPGWQG
jgi:hypothetical protein